MAQNYAIALVEDDEDLRDALAEQLRLHDEFIVTPYSNAMEAIKGLKLTHADLVVMDVGLPDMDGREAVKILRKNNFTSPIIMLTGAVSDADTIYGLDAGANDYIAKPFRIAVLLARMRAQLRQFEASDEAVFAIGNYSFQPGAKLLLEKNGTKVRLTDKETAILRYLYRHSSAPIARETLLAEVWGYNSGVTTHTLETHIYRLRQKIEGSNLLVTENGGYRLNL